MTRGFTLSVAVLLAALVVAMTMIPRRMRASQAEATDGDDGMASGNGDLRQPQMT